MNRVYSSMDQKDPIYNKLSYICKNFGVEGDVIVYRLIPSGHINTAYYVGVYDGKEVQQYLIQRVNTYVFREPEAMMNNIDLITKHIMQKQPTMEHRRRLHFRNTPKGENFLIIDENGEQEFWRLYNYVESSVSFDKVDGDTKVLQMSGHAFGKFMKDLQDFDAGKLVESIPNFHNTRMRLNSFVEDVKRDDAGRVAEVQKEINEVLENREFGETLCRMIDAGELPIRVTHNDTKTNNILFDRETLDPLVIIDLDTCMPGLACYDFGDTIRFGACTREEDVADGMELDLSMYRAFVEGFIKETGDFLTDKELDSMAYGACIMTYEVAARFLADYLNGDKYFRIDYPTQNLERARAQLALYRSMKEHFDEMNAIVHEVAGR